MLNGVHKKLGGKAQALSTESIFAYLVFLVIFVAIVFLWNATTTRVAEADHNFEVQDLAIIITENLVRTTGTPENWEEYDYLSANPEDLGVEVIGLAEKSRILNEDKVYAFIEMMNNSPTANNRDNNYSSHKWLLGLSKPRFTLEFYFTITNVTGNVTVINGKKCVTGREDPKDAIYKFPITRTAILNDEIVKVTLIAWNPKD